MRRIVVVVALAAFGAVGIYGASAAPTVVKVKLSEFKVAPSVKAVQAGKVTFVVTNVGKINHEMVVVKTNVPPGKLKENPKTHRVSEAGAVGEAGEVHHGQTKTVTLTLKPGKYQLFCNLAAHYSAGQWIGFTVK